MRIQSQQKNEKSGANRSSPDALKVTMVTGAKQKTKKTYEAHAQAPVLATFYSLAKVAEDLEATDGVRLRLVEVTTLNLRMDLVLPYS